MRFLDYHCYPKKAAGIHFYYFGLEESTEFFNKCLNNPTVVYIKTSCNWLAIDNKGKPRALHCFPFFLKGHYAVPGYALN